MAGQSISLGGSPELFPYGLDVRNDTVSFIRLSREDFARASFLDARILTPKSLGPAMSWGQVSAAIDAAKLTERCAFIFHIGHVGSTLLSRLVGEHPGAFALREPVILRTFAQLRSEPEVRPPSWGGGDVDVRLSGCLKLLSRTFDAQQRAVIKATSFASELAAELLSRPTAPRAVFMYVRPESYFATILGGENSRQEAKMLTPSRLRRLHRRLGRDVWHLQSLSEGETLALGWACETSALAQSARAAGERAMGVDFERFLVQPAAVLFDIFRRLEINASAAEAEAIVAGPHMRHYSKAPEYAYDAALRSEVLNEARATHGAKIRRGLAWLDVAAKEFAPVREALAFASAVRA
jgi:hypothetical protein